MQPDREPMNEPAHSRNGQSQLEVSRSLMCLRCSFGVSRWSPPEWFWLDEFAPVADGVFVPSQAQPYPNTPLVPALSMEDMNVDGACEIIRLKRKDHHLGQGFGFPHRLVSAGTRPLAMTILLNRVTAPADTTLR